MAKPISNAWKLASSSCLYEGKESCKWTDTKLLHLISILLLTTHWHGGYTQRRIVMLPGAVLTLFDSDSSELNLNVTSGMGWRFGLNTGQWLYGQADCCSLQRLCSCEWNFGIVVVAYVKPAIQHIGNVPVCLPDGICMLSSWPSVWLSVIWKLPEEKQTFCQRIVNIQSRAVTFVSESFFNEWSNILLHDALWTCK
jgi:hypothetical protein